MGHIDTILFVKTKENDILLVQIYVDDITFCTTNSYLYEEFFNCMHREFEMSMMGELKFLFGLQIKQLKDGIFINHEKYTRDLLKRFTFDYAKTAKTPMIMTTKLDKDKKGKNVDIKVYRSMIGSLLYLNTSRPDIMFSMSMCARF